MIMKHPDTARLFSDIHEQEKSVQLLVLYYVRLNLG